MKNDLNVHGEAELTMRFDKEQVAEIVMRSLLPDNEPVPKGLKIEVNREGNAVIFRVFSERTVASLLATLDDIISTAIIALESLRALGD